MNTQIKRADIGLVGVLTLLGQLGIGFHSNYNVGDEIKELSREIHEIRYDQDKYYAKKTQISEISTKLDNIEVKVNSLTVQISSIKKKLKNLNQYLTAETCEDDRLAQYYSGAK